MALHDLHKTSLYDLVLCGSWEPEENKFLTGWFGSPTRRAECMAPAHGNVNIEFSAKNRNGVLYRVTRFGEISLLGRYFLAFGEFLAEKKSPKIHLNEAQIFIRIQNFIYQNF
jgi:hypothetical protein